MRLNPFDENIDYWLTFKNRFIKNAAKILIILSFFNIALVIYDIGFTHSKSTTELLSTIYNISILVHFFILLPKLILEFTKKRFPLKRLISESLLVLIIFLIIDARLIITPLLAPESVIFNLLTLDIVLYIVFLLIFLIEFSKTSLSLFNLSLNPALIFVLSFLLIIILGTGLLLLPNATTTGEISLIDAVFTSTSAVCVTGLIVMDTANDFTMLGQFFILMLIQIGGLGIMTFTSFFAFFFKGNTSYQSQIFLKSVVNEEQLGQIFRTLIMIVIFTFSIEFIGFLLIYGSISETQFTDIESRIWFSAFHTVSAFCNAGFSTLSNSLYESGFRFNYNLHLIIAILIIIGGLGFPILFNLSRYIKSITFRRTKKYILDIPVTYVPRMINLNSKLVIITTAALLLFGMIFYFIAEHDYTLEGRSLYGMFVTTLFGSVTPRTAGFNTVDMSALALPTILIYLFLMWIGASPGSTGGGIKTSTFALVILNTLSITKGKDRVEVFRREIHNESIRRAFSIMFLSFIIIGMAIFFITLFDSELGLIEIIFECFSAFSTVGLSLGITGSLSTPSKMVIIATMFIGRVGTLTMIIAFIRKVRTLNYRYPAESIFIN